MKGGTIYQEGLKWIWKSPPYYENGKQKRTRKSFNTKEEAEYQQRVFMAKFCDENNYVHGLTVRQAFEYWQKHEWQTEENVSFKSQSNYISVYNKHILPFIGDEEIDNLNCNAFNFHLNDLVNEGRTVKTTRNIKYALAILLDYCERLGLIDVNNKDKIKLPSKKNEKCERDKIVNLLSEADYQKIYKCMDLNCSMYAPVVLFLRETGIRIEELAIKKSDISGRTLTISRAIKRKPDKIVNNGTKVRYKSKLVVSNYLKTCHAYRNIPLSNNALKAIEQFEEWKKENNIHSEFIFCTRTGGYTEQRNILRAFHEACKKSNIDKCGLHSLRKLFCKTLKDKQINGIPTDWEIVRRIMGHSNVEITKNFYYSLSDDDIDELAFALSNN